MAFRSAFPHGCDGRERHGADAVQLAKRDGIKRYGWNLIVAERLCCAGDEACTYPRTDNGVQCILIGFKRNSSNKNVLALVLTIPRLPACNVLLLTWRTRELGSSAAQCVQRPGKRLGDAFPVVICHGYFAERAAV